MTNVKKVVLSFLALISFWVVFSTSTLTFASNDTVVRVGYSPNDDLVLNIDNFGFEGYGYEVLRKIEEFSPLQFEFVNIEGSLMGALDEDKVDVVGLFSKSAERENNYLYLETPFGSFQNTLCTKSTAPIAYADYESIDGKTVATYHGNLANDELTEALSKNNSSVTFVYGELHNYTEIEADFYLLYTSKLYEEQFTSVLNLEKHYNYLISNFGNESLMTKINDALLEVVATEGDFFLDLEKKYYEEHAHILHRDLTKEELAIIKQRPLRVAYEQNHRPLTFKNADDQADGAVIDLVNELVNMYGFEVEYVPYDASNPNSFPDNVDLVVSAIGDQSHIEKNFKPTESYYEMQMLATVPRHVANSSTSPEVIRKASPEIGTLDYLYVDFESFDEVATENKIVYFNTFDELLSAYEKGKIDMAIFTDSGTTYANSYLGNLDNYTYSTDFTLNFHISVANNISNEYTPILNIMLDNVSVHRYEEMLIKNTSTHFYETTFWDAIFSRWYFLLILATIVAAVLTFLRYRRKTKHNQELLNSVYTDSLTSLLAFGKFNKIVNFLLKEAKPNEYELICFDIDMFKTLNTHFGSERGSEILIAIAKALMSAFENESAAICRKTSDHFLIFRKVDQGGKIEELFEKFILPSVKEKMPTNYNVVFSFGKVVIDDCTQSSSTILDYADIARSHSKDEHVTMFTTFDSKMKKAYEDKISITFKMEKALADKEFVVEYQPKIDLNTLKICGAEALVRWHQKDGQKLFPNVFIPIFEENGFISNLDLYVLNSVCVDIKSSCRALEVPRISVNLSAHTLLSHNIVKNIVDILHLHKVSPSEIEFELTESAVERNTEKFLDVSKQLRALGFAISIDDFGAGVSSLNRLSAVEADILKLDKTFLDDSGKVARSMSVVKDTVQMAKNLNMKVVAEGVETKEQARWLKNIGCDYAQGYYFAQSMSTTKFTDFLKKNLVRGI